MKNLTITEARNDLLGLAAEIERDPSMVVEIRKHGKRVVALVSAELYDALVETLDVLGDEETTSKLRRALREIDRRKGISWRTARKRLGLAE